MKIDCLSEKQLRKLALVLTKGIINKYRILFLLRRM